MRRIRKGASGAFSRRTGGESTAAWCQFLADLDARGLKRPEFVIVDGAPGLEAALVALWGDKLPIQRCTVHKHRNLLAHAPKHLHDELTADYRDMIYADIAVEIETRRKAFLRKWRLKCRAVADSLKEAGERLFTFTRLDPSQWKSARTTDAIDNPHLTDFVAVGIRGAAARSTLPRGSTRGEPLETHFAPVSLGRDSKRNSTSEHGLAEHALGFRSPHSFGPSDSRQRRWYHRGAWATPWRSAAFG